MRVVALATLASRVLGMVRDILFAGLFGLGPIGDAFLFAFRIPNLARKLFGEGALSAAFLPAFARELEVSRKTAQPSAWELASAVFALMAGFLITLTILGELVLWWIARSTDSPDARLRRGRAAVMWPYAVRVCLAAQVTAVLHALEHFTWPALVPVALNVVQIAAAWWIAPQFSDPVMKAYAMSWSVVFAGLIQLCLQLPTLFRLGYQLGWNWSRAWPGLRDVLWSMTPITLGLSITQINTFLDSLIAWGFAAPPGGGRLPWPGSPAYPLQEGAVSALYYGERLYQFPLGVFGIALSTVLFSRMARHVARGESDQLKHDLSLGLRLVLAIGLPASVGLILTATPVTTLLFMRGEFGAEDVRRTAAMIATYGAGVWAYCGIPVLYRGFYACGDRSTPVKIGLIAVALDLTMNLSLIWVLAERGLACSTAISATVHLALLTWLVQYRVGTFDWPVILKTGGRAVVCTAVMTIACLIASAICPTSGGRGIQLAAVLAPLSVGIGVYLAMAKVVGLDEIWMFLRRS